ncbi:MAG: polysaccharide deacetylase family protein [Patescibacteria group bacterium]|nr:polysaccharide deacetylase family protein [Patescibacteria group bacterium]
MPGTLLIGYDVERIPGRVPGEKWVGRPVPEDATRVFLENAVRIHREAQVPATLFVVGRNIEKHLPQLEACLASGWFEIAQHTHEHYPLKTVVEESPENVYLQGLPFDRIEEQLARPVELLQKHLGVHCRGVTAPYCYYRGLSDRPDILEIIARLGMSYVRSYGRDCHDYFPLDWDVQPFWYARQGFPELLEIPIQGWIDAQWRREHGWENWPAYHDYLRSRIDQLAGSEWCWSLCQHDWTSILDDSRLDWTRRLLEYAAGRVASCTHANYYEQMQRDCAVSEEAAPSESRR